MKRTLLSVTTLCALVVSLAGCSADESPSAPTLSSTVVSSPSTTVLPPTTQPPVQPTVPQQPTPVPPPPAHSPPVKTPVASPGKPTTVVPAACFDPADFSDDWNTSSKERGVGLVMGQLFDVRPGQHECWDRIVFDLDTTDYVGFEIGYVPVVTQDGSGFEVPVAGSAALQLTIDAWAPELFAGYGYNANWGALREIKYAGSFEGVTTFAIGVTGVLPFAVSHWQEGDTMHVIIDIYNR